MIPIKCRVVNLDVSPLETWPLMMPHAVPRVGERIESKHEWPEFGRLCLEVVGVWWRYGEDGYYAELHLSLPTYWQSVRQFGGVYGKVAGMPITHWTS